jgi:hypothetical protein
MLHACLFTLQDKDIEEFGASEVIMLSPRPLEEMTEEEREQEAFMVPLTSPIKEYVPLMLGHALRMAQCGVWVFNLRPDIEYDIQAGLNSATEPPEQLQALIVLLSGRITEAVRNHSTLH